jgi:hypothetical protein
MAREHVKLWRYESARFQALPYAARALAAYLLKFVDEGGHLPLGKRAPVAAVAIAVGADAHERRALKPAVEALLDHGYLAIQDGLLVVGNFPRYQHESDVKPTRSERQVNAKLTSSEREVDAKLTRDEREIRVSARNHVDGVLAQNVLSSEKREEERESQTRAPVRPIPLDERVSHSDAQDAFGRLRVAHGGGPFRASMREHTRVSELADFANAQGATRDERMAALETTIRGYLARADEWATTRGWPISGMQDFGVCLAAGRKLVAPVSQRDTSALTPLEQLRHERESLMRLHGTGRFAALPQAERIASIERRDAVELALAGMESPA